MQANRIGRRTRNDRDERANPNGARQRIRTGAGFLSNPRSNTTSRPPGSRRAGSEPSVGGGPESPAQKTDPDAWWAGNSNPRPPPGLSAAPERFRGIPPEPRTNPGRRRRAIRAGASDRHGAGSARRRRAPRTPCASGRRSGGRSRSSVWGSDSGSCRDGAPSGSRGPAGRTARPRSFRRPSRTSATTRRPLFRARSSASSVRRQHGAAGCRLEPMEASQGGDRR